MQLLLWHAKQHLRGSGKQFGIFYDVIEKGGNVASR
jgi:hypothetical protein